MLGLGVAPRPRLGDGRVHVGPHRRERPRSTASRISVASSTRDREALGEAVGLHPVGEAVGDHLRLGTHLGGDLLGRDAEDAVPRWRRGCRAPRRRRSTRPGSSDEVRDHPQLDLVVVGDEQRVARRAARRPPGSAGRPRCAPGCCGGSGASEESRPVRATVWLNEAWMRPSGATSASRPLAVGGAELLDLAVAAAAPRRSGARRGASRASGRRSSSRSWSCAAGAARACRRARCAAAAAS